MLRLRANRNHYMACRSPNIELRLLRKPAICGCGSARFNVCAAAGTPVPGLQFDGT